MTVAGILYGPSPTYSETVAIDVPANSVGFTVQGTPTASSGAIGIVPGATPNRGYITIGDSTNWLTHFARNDLTPLVTISSQDASLGINTAGALALEKLDVIGAGFFRGTTASTTGEGIIISYVPGTHTGTIKSYLNGTGYEPLRIEGSTLALKVGTSSSLSIEGLGSTGLLKNTDGGSVSIATAADVPAATINDTYKAAAFSKIGSSAIAWNFFTQEQMSFWSRSLSAASTESQGAGYKEFDAGALAAGFDRRRAASFWVPTDSGVGTPTSISFYMAVRMRIPSIPDAQTKALVGFSETTGWSGGYVAVGADGSVSTTKFVVSAIVGSFASSVNLDTGWHTIELLRVSTTTTIYIDGVSVGTGNAYSNSADVGSLATNVTNGTTAATQKLDVSWIGHAFVTP